MGALHGGHLSLVQEARKISDHIVVSIFVNPTQFGPREDFTKYPRPIEEDLKKCERAGVDFVFNPSTEEMYREGVPDVFIDTPSLTSVLEGQKRPGHFKGVCQVVGKLFDGLGHDGSPEEGNIHRTRALYYIEARARQVNSGAANSPKNPSPLFSLQTLSCPVPPFSRLGFQTFPRLPDLSTIARPFHGFQIFPPRDELQPLPLGAVRRHTVPLGVTLG